MYEGKLVVTQEQEQTQPSGKKTMSGTAAFKKLALYDLIVSGVIALIFTVAGLMASGAVADTVGMSTWNKILTLVGLGIPAFLMSWIVWFGIIAIVGAMILFLWAFFSGRRTPKV